MRLKADSLELEKKRRRKAPPEPILLADTCIEDWNALGFSISELFPKGLLLSPPLEDPHNIKSSSVAPLGDVALSRSASFSEHYLDKSSIMCERGECTKETKYVDDSLRVLTGRAFLDGIDHSSDNSHEMEHCISGRLIDSEIPPRDEVDSSLVPLPSDPMLDIVFEPIRPTSNPLSAGVSGFLWDVPYALVPDSIPLPSFTSTPLKVTPPSSSGQSSQDRRVSVPYPDLFDFSMYDVSIRSSQDIFGRPTSISLPSGDTVVLVPAPISPFHLVTNKHAAPDRDRYRNAAYSRLNTASTPTKLKPSSAMILSPLHITYTSLQKHHSVVSSRGSASSFGNMDSPDVRASIVGKLQDTMSGCSESSDAVNKWEIASLDDVSARLRAACDDLSRAIWTEEEFLKLVSA